jgi:hypothetical protein
MIPILGHLYHEPYGRRSVFEPFDGLFAYTAAGSYGILMPDFETTPWPYRHGAIAEKG